MTDPPTTGSRAAIERIEALRSNALLMIEHSEAQAARSYWMGQQSAFDAALSVLRELGCGS